jgi:hypothetical protein
MCIRYCSLLNVQYLQRYQPIDNVICKSTEIFNDDCISLEDIFHSHLGATNNHHQLQGRPSWPVPIQNLVSETYESVLDIW